LGQTACGQFFSCYTLDFPFGGLMPVGFGIGLAVILALILENHWQDSKLRENHRFICFPKLSRNSMK
jgi:hypothetical protein